jgi:hypothetical protein
LYAKKVPLDVVFNENPASVFPIYSEGMWYTDKKETIPAAPLLFEAFFREALSFQHHLTGFFCINVSL